MTAHSGASPRSPLRRRTFLHGALAGAAGALGPASGAARAAPLKGNIRQSVAFWCFNSAGEKWDIEKTCRVARELGCRSVELVPPEHWGVLKRHGLICAVAPNGMPGAPFVRGFNNPKYHAEVIGRTRQAMDDCAAAGFPGVIAFTGYRWRDADNPRSGEIPRDEGAANCVRALKEVARHAERCGVSLYLEQLNTRDDSHPMKGHPGYQGDDLDWVAGIVRAVGSPRVRLLFDVYHVQVMHGDVIRRLEQNREILGHVHTAGNPGRGELDERQEIHYPPIMRKLLEMSYGGYVGQEFIPTRNPFEGLRQAVATCDV